MKTKLILLLLLIACFSCTTSNKPVSDAEKATIIGQVKEAVKAMIKGGEEANFDMTMGQMLNSSEFVYIINGKTYTYQEIMDAYKTIMSTMTSQKATIVDEKYSVIDNSTVLYTTNSKWLMNFKDGHSVLQDPWIVQFTYKKTEGGWKIISGVESGSEEIVTASETPKELNQVELMKQWLGTWQTTVNKDTVVLWEAKPYGKAFIITVYQVVKGKKSDSYMINIGYDNRDDKIKGYNLFPNTDFVTWTGMFTTDKIFKADALDTFKPEKVWWKNECEFTAPTEMIIRGLNAEGLKTGEWTYKKVK